ncbi:TPA: IS1 family transposase, partial [Klebsiella pneumoniae]
MASVNIHCPRCQSAQVYRHGQNPKGHDRFRGNDSNLLIVFYVQIMPDD